MMSTENYLPRSMLMTSFAESESGERQEGTEMWPPMFPSTLAVSYLARQFQYPVKGRRHPYQVRLARHLNLYTLSRGLVAHFQPLNGDLLQALVGEGLILYVRTTIIRIIDISLSNEFVIKSNVLFHRVSQLSPQRNQCIIRLLIMCLLGLQ